MENKIGIFFDLEGTLIASGYQTNDLLLNELHRKTYEHLKEFGIPLYILDKNIKSIYLRNDSVEWIESQHPDLYTSYMKYVESFMKKYDIQAAMESQLYYDSIDILNYLTYKKHRMGLVTNTSKEAAELMITKHNIKSYFDVIYTRNDVKKIKPDPTMLNLAINDLGTKENFLIGDSKVDYLTAKKANAKSIIIKRDGIMPDYDVDFFITNLLELKINGLF